MPRPNEAFTQIRPLRAELNSCPWPRGRCFSATERAFLELLSEVGVRQPLAEARELAESTYGFRASVLGELLRDCTNVKTVRLCLQLGRELALPWAKKFDPARLPTGSDRPWVSQTNEGMLVLKK